MKIYNKILHLLFVTTILFASCQQEEYDCSVPLTGETITLNFISDPMQQYNVTTRSSDVKNDDEKRINRLYVFFFAPDGNYLTGGYLTGYPTAPEDGGYYATGEGVNTLKIDKNNFTNMSDAKQATIYVVANVEPTLFSKDENEDGRPDNIKNLSDLETLVYTPTNTVSTGLPIDGMPMVGKKNIDLTGETGSEQERTIEMKALMARVDLNIQINSDNSSSTGNYPRLQLMDWTVKNLPTRVAFTAPATNTQTGDGDPAWSDWTRDITIPSQQMVYNKNGQATLSFYMFENMQNADNSNFKGYPEKIEEYQKQRYKPQLANANATAIILHGFYSTYNEDGTGSATYEVRYTLYLGNNHTDNFQVERNHQYKNNITIKGLLSQDSETGEYTFDARVDVEQDDNEFYFTILRERNHDAHFCVTPMDVYFFEEGNPTMEVVLGEVNDETGEVTNVPTWIGLERVSATDMAAGTLSNSDFNDESKYINAGALFTAGHGKRKYFTTNLVDELKKREMLTSTRDRIYFYLDENLSDTDDRSATVTLLYKNGDKKKHRTFQIEQAHLLAVTYTETQKGGDGQEHTIYMEQYEEYLDHYDPLDKYNTEQIYEGLPWAREDSDIATKDIGTLYYPSGGLLPSAYNDSYNNYYDGWEYTSYVVSERDKEQQVMTLNDRPKSAFQYCHNKNKRKSDGIVPANYRTNLVNQIVEQSNQSKWFLPAITQMEEALRKYYLTYLEFQKDFYWSASAAKEGSGGILESEDGDRARATKIEDGVRVPSDQKESSMWENGGGNAKRTQPLRIRAFRKDLNKPDYE